MTADGITTAWLTHHILADVATHIKGGYSWDASRYLPVLSYDEDGEPKMGVTRRAPG